jgi:AraC-like DNA-binding protein
MTVTHRHALAPGQTFTGVRFRPGKATCFLRVPAQRLTDRSVEIEDLWGAAGRRLREHLSEGRSFHEQADLLAGHLTASAEATPSDRALDAIAAADGNVNLEWVARHANLSLRQFRRRCLAATGLSPKLLCRVLRFRGALRVARAGRFRTWAEVAAECGYYDQAHLIRDFQEFTGAAPGVTVLSKTGAASRPYNRGVGRTTREAYARADVGRH